MLVFSIDSLKLRIPIHKVEILEPQLKGKWMKALINVEYGDIIEDTEKFKQMAFGVEKNGIKTKYLCQKISNGRIVEEFLCILFNSKLLKNKYIQGITAENIGIIHNELLQQNIVKVSFEDFLNGICTDIDFKSDYSLKKNESFTQLLDYLDRMTIKTADREKGNRIFRQKGNFGIEWSKRQFSSNSNPYVKVYHKSVELLYNSNVFYYEYLKEMDPNLIRAEWTLKGKKHAESFAYHVENGKKHVVQFDDMRLLNLLALSNNHKYQMFIQVMSKHIEGILKMTTKQKEGVSPLDQVFLNIIEDYKERKLGLIEVVTIMTKGLTKESRYQYKKKIEELWSVGMETEKFEQEYEVYDFLCELTGKKD